MNTDDVKVRLIADLKRFTSNMKQASRQMISFGAVSQKALALAKRALERFSSFARRTIRYGLVAIAGLSAAIIKIGADIEEAENLFEVAFGNMADDVRQWSEELAKRLKLSASGLRKTAGNFQLFLTGLDLGAEASKKLSVALTELTMDMASFRNLKFDVAVQKIQAALAGEAEPMRRLGVTINDVTLKTWAQKHGLDANTQAWSESQKVLARAALLFEKLEIDVGDLNKTQDSTTNLLRSMGEQFKDMAKAIYEVWKPQVQASLQSVRDWVLKNREAVAKWIGETVVSLAAGAGAILDSLNQVKQWFIDHRATIVEWASVTVESIGAVAVAVQQLLGLLLKLPRAAEDVGFWGELKKQMEKDTVAEYEFAMKEAGRRAWAPMAHRRETGAVDMALYRKIRAEVESRYMAEMAKDQLFGDGGIVPAESLRQIETAGAKVKKMLAELESASAAAGDEAGDATDAAAEKIKSYREMLQALFEQWDTFGTDGAAALGKIGEATVDITAAYRRMANDMDRTSRESWEVRKSLLAEEYRKYVEIIEDKVLVLKWFKEQQEKMAIEEAKRGENLIAGFAAGVREMQRELQTLGGLGANLARKLRDGIVGSLSDAVFEARNLGEAMKEVGRSMARMAFEWSLNQAVTRGMGVVFGGLGSGGPSTAGVPAGDINLAMANVAHAGGILGKDRFPKRLVAQSVFSGAPRLHKGLAPDEVPAILQRGERVLPKGQAWSTTRIESLLDQLVTLQQRQANQKMLMVDRRQGVTKDQVAGIIIDDVDYGGPISRKMGI